MKVIYALTVLLTFFSCQHRQYHSSKNALKENSPHHLKKPYVIMISIDGYRYDYARLHEAPFMTSLEKKGSYADLKPVFPTKTFPNHVSLITGLKAGQHGIVSNRFFDRQRKESYLIGKAETTTDGSWYGGEPIWVAAHKQGMISGSFFWVGSDADIQQTHPTYYYPYDKSIPNTQRVSQVLQWLKMPEKKRPHFITLYFSDVDSAGHRYGPNSVEVRKAVHEIDHHISHLYQEVAKLDLPVNFVIVSDHGMAKINQNIYLNELLPSLSKIRMEERGPFCHLYIEDSETLSKTFATLSRLNTLTVYKQQDIPKHFGYDNKNRVGDLVIVMKPGFYLLPKKIDKLVTGGTHGYLLKESPEMKGIFYATGPNINKVGRIPELNNVDVYPFVMKLLGLKIKTKIDGDQKTLKKLYRHN